jgi:hypothetical protein
MEPCNAASCPNDESNYGCTHCGTTYCSIVCYADDAERHAEVCNDVGLLAGFRGKSEFEKVLKRYAEAFADYIAAMKKWLSQSYFESEAEYKQIQSYAQQVSKTLGTLASQPEALFKMLNGIRTDSKLGKNPFEVAAVELRREFYSFNKEMMQNATIGLYGTTASPMLDKTTAFIEALYRLTETAAQQTETGRKASQIMAGKQASEIEAALLQLVGNTAISQAAKLRTAFVETLRKLGAGIDREFARSIKK